MVQSQSSSFESPKTFESVQEYFGFRASLIGAEQKLGYEGKAQRTSLEAEAEKIVQSIKSWEERNHHGVQNDGSGCEAGHRFLHARGAIEKSQLYEISRRAPKGTLLHCHFDSILPPRTLLDDARKQSRLHIKCDAPLISEGFFASALPLFCVLPEDRPFTEMANIFNRSYVSGSWMKYSEFLKLFPGGPERAEGWIAKRMVLQAEDTYNPRQTVDGIWKKFIRSVTVARSLLCYETAFRGNFRRILWKFAQEGITYAEIRFSLSYLFTISNDDGTREYSQSDMMQILADVLDEEIPKIRSTGLTFYGAKVIYACLRSATKEAMNWCMNTCIELKQKFPDLICAFDMQGQEDPGHPLTFFVPELLAMRSKANSLGLDLPFIFHAGETLDHGGDTDSNLYDAILLGTKRIGHGFSIARHPLLMQLCKERNIAIETCPISNEILGLCPTTKTHHLPVLLSNCVPCTINSDDPGSWDAGVLSHDFYQAMMGSNTMSLLGWRVLAEWSIEHSCMDPEVQEQAYKDLKKSWTTFCKWIVDNYSQRE